MAGTVHILTISDLSVFTERGDCLFVGEIRDFTLGSEGDVVF